MGEIVQFDSGLKRVCLVRNVPGASGLEVIRFVSRSERERARLIQEARAIYDRIFPPVDPLCPPQDEELGGHPTTGTANFIRGEGILS